MRLILLSLILISVFNTGLNVITKNSYAYTVNSSSFDNLTSQSEVTKLTNKSDLAAGLNGTDTVLPTIQIVEPNWCSAARTGNIKVMGNSSDNGSGIRVVELRVDKNKYLTANPLSPGNWSSWSVSIDIQDSKPHRLLARAIDYAGNKDWADVTINSPQSKGTLPPAHNLTEGKKGQFAFVEPTFTNAAYSENHFYSFYDLHERTTEMGEKVTTDLERLTAPVPPEPDREYFLNFVEHVRNFAPNSTVSIIRDEDVYNGYIFRADGSNAYDVLFLLHNEYAARQDYDNFKKFVGNGGTIVFLDGNVFYAQVKYDPSACAVTLVYGHDWLFDGKAATKSVHEGYYDENKKWVGSNFLYGDISAPVTFSSNPFNYRHFEENYVNNPNATILYDYGAHIPESVRNDNDQVVYPKIATYELNYGKGKVIMMGLYTQNLGGNDAFMKFFDHIILPRALGQPYKFNNAAAADGNESVAFWWMNTGRVSKMNVESPSNKVNISLERSKQIEDTLMLTLPNSLVGSSDSGVRNITITVDGKPVSYNQSVDDIEPGFEIPLSPKATGVQVLVKTSNNSSDTSANRGAQQVKIVIPQGAYDVTNTEFYFPSTVTVPVGTIVSWTNNDTELHTASSGGLGEGGPTGRLFESGYLAPGKVFTHVFADKGIFDYFCILHPFMKGRVIVK